MRSRHDHIFSGFTKTVLSAAVAIVVAGPAMAQTATGNSDEGQPRAKDDNVRLGTIMIVGEGGKLGAGQMLNEDSVKGRSTVTKAATEKNLATGNPYQALALLPGINTYNHDATGLFGGGLTIRGFNSDQLGFTINGVPVNDSGNFAVFPQEYVDQENLCTQTVSQGNADAEAPHAGASGGAVSVTSCDPEDKQRFRFAQTLGELRLSRTFARFDTGRFADNKAKLFLSMSHTQADKWKGEGGAKKDHLDTAFRYDLSGDNVILGSLLYNRAVNNNIMNLSLTQLNSFGYNYDYSTSFTPGHLVSGAGAQKETGPTPQYYKLALNPFENAIASVSGSFKIANETYLKVQPYYWYGFGTGGVQQTALSETAFLNTATGKTGAGVDLNGDGDKLDTVVMARSSVTKTQRPGVTAEINTTFDNHQVRVGVWYERAEHRQTQPAVAVKADGEPVDIWLQNGQTLRPDGSTYQGRDWKTVSTAYQLYANDNVSFMGDRGLLSLGVRAPTVNRDVTNYANEGFTTTYNIQKNYSDVLPQVGVRFNVDKQQQVFVNVGKNFRAAPNFAFTGNNVRLNAAGQVELVTEALPETSIMTDLGYRVQTKSFSLSATLFNAQFKDRQANAYDPIADKSTYTNAGNVRTSGLELEAGSAPFGGGFTAYASFTAQTSEIQNDITVAKGQVIPTSGKQFTLTPNQLIGTSLQYASGAFYARLKFKYTGRQYATLMNDEEVPSYTTGDLDAGYNLGSFGGLKNAQLRFNLTNITNAQYRNPSSNSVVNATQVGGTAPSTVFYYLGAPRFAAISFSADF
jgi:iron complex outermembrane receptor protein